MLQTGYEGQYEVGMTATGATVVISQYLNTNRPIIKQIWVYKGGKEGKDPADQRRPWTMDLTASESLALSFRLWTWRGTQRRNWQRKQSFPDGERPRRSTLGLATLGPLERKMEIELHRHQMRLRLLVRAAPASWSLDPATVFFTGVDLLWIPNRRISLAWDLYSVALKPSILTALVISILSRNWQCCFILDHATLTGYRDETFVRGVAVAIDIGTPPFNPIHAKGSVANGDARETFLWRRSLRKGMRRGGPTG